MLRDAALTEFVDIGLGRDDGHGLSQTGQLEGPKFILVEDSLLELQGIVAQETKTVEFVYRHHVPLLEAIGMENLFTTQDRSTGQPESHTGDGATLNATFANNHIERLLLQGSCETLDTIGSYLIIAVEEIDIIARSLCHPCIAGSRQSPVLRMMHHPEPDGALIRLQHFPDHFHAIISATIIDQDTLQGILTGLVHHTLQTSSNVRRHIIDRNDNGYLHD